MNTFKEYLATSILAERSGVEANAELIYQKILDVLDDAHIDFSEDKISFHVGKIIKNSTIDILLTIRPAGSDNVRLGRSKNGGTFSIVVDTRSKLPARKNIDSFLAKDRTRAFAIKNGITQYLTNHFESGTDPSTRTKYEEDNDNNLPDKFETHYENLIKELSAKMEECGGAVQELHAEMDTEDVGKRETAKMAIRHLTKEYFGGNPNEFKKIAKGMVKGQADGLTKENKARLEKRIDSFYEQKIKPLLKH